MLAAVHTVPYASRRMRLMWGTSRVHDATSERRHHKHAHLKVAGQKHIVDIKPVHLLHQLRGAYAYRRTMRIARAQSMRSAGTYIFIETSLLCAPPGMFAGEYEHRAGGAGERSPYRYPVMWLTTRRPTLCRSLVCAYA